MLLWTINMLLIMWMLGFIHGKPDLAISLKEFLVTKLRKWWEQLLIPTGWWNLKRRVLVLLKSSLLSLMLPTTGLCVKQWLIMLETSQMRDCAGPTELLKHLMIDYVLSPKVSLTNYCRYRILLVVVLRQIAFHLELMEDRYLLRGDGLLSKELCQVVIMTKISYVTTILWRNAITILNNPNCQHVIK